MKRLEVNAAIRHIYMSLGFKRLNTFPAFLYSEKQLRLIRTVVCQSRQAKDVATCFAVPPYCHVTIAKRASAEATQTLRAIRGSKHVLHTPACFPVFIQNTSLREATKNHIRRTGTYHSVLWVSEDHSVGLRRPELDNNFCFSPFHRPRRPLGRVEVQLYSILDLCTRRG